MSVTFFVLNMALFLVFAAASLLLCLISYRKGCGEGREEGYCKCDEEWRARVKELDEQAIMLGGPMDGRTMPIGRLTNRFVTPVAKSFAPLWMVSDEAILAHEPVFDHAAYERQQPVTFIFKKGKP